MHLWYNKFTVVIKWHHDVNLLAREKFDRNWRIKTVSLKNFPNIFKSSL